MNPEEFALMHLVSNANPWVWTLKLACTDPNLYMSQSGEVCSCPQEAQLLRRD